MSILTEFKNIITDLGVSGTILAAALLLLFVVQAVYFLSCYGRVPRRRDSDAPRANTPLSVVTVLNDTDYTYVEEVLPQILSQDHPEFEVVVVDLASDVDFSETLKQAAIRDGRLNIVHFVVNPLFPISNKMAVNIAMKAAHYECLLLTTPDTVPGSPSWLTAMAAGFASADVVLGYCRVETKPGSGNAAIRLDNTALAMRWLNPALRGRPYRGMQYNMGLTRKVYFDNDGFNFLNLNIGEDDLFVQFLLDNGARAAVVCDRESIAVRRQWGGPGWWHRERLLRSNTFRYYPSAVKRYVSGELVSRALFFSTATALIVIAPFEVKLFGVALLLLRFLMVSVQVARTGKRLGERGMWPMVLPCDLAMPVYEAVLAIVRRFRRTPGLWR